MEDPEEEHPLPSGEHHYVTSLKDDRPGLPMGGGGGSSSTSSSFSDSEDEEDAITPGRAFRRESIGLPRPVSSRNDHLEQLVMTRRASVKALKEIMDGRTASYLERQSGFDLTEQQMANIQEESKFIKDVKRLTKDVNRLFPKVKSNIEVRVENFSYSVKVDQEDESIRTIANQNPLNQLFKWTKRLYRGELKSQKRDRVVLDRINLRLKPGKMYLLLGDPGTGGKEALLKAIAGRLYERKDAVTEGSILYNGVTLENENGLHIANAISYVDKIDFHAPRMTVRETFEYAFNCKSGGSHNPGSAANLNPEAKALLKKFDAERLRVVLMLQALGLEHVADTFVGNADVRGVSGGQRRRVSLGEMLLTEHIPIFVGDEISTGLDAAATYDICRSLMFFGHTNKLIRILSLLQPSPETVSLFDEVILMAEGKVLFAGPISEVEGYFKDLGYQPPDQMDVADFLQEISTNPAPLYSADFDMNANGKPYTMSEFADRFRMSLYHQRIETALNKPWKSDWNNPPKTGSQIYGRILSKYQNSFPRYVRLNLFRTLLIWSRDKRFLIANAIKNIIMGVSVGGVFFQTDNYISIFGVCFQINLFIMLGAMTSAPAQVSDRIIYRKHNDSNFFGVASYVIGKAIGLMPQSFMDVIIFGTIIYWMVGLTAAVENYFIFIAILFAFNVVMNQLLSIFAATARTKTDVQSMGAVILLFLILFSGFIVSPDVIPSYYIWIYWLNPLAWVYRAMLVNEFRSSEYDSLVDGSNLTSGELILVSQGFTDGNNKAYDEVWIGYNFAYLAGFFLLSVIMTAVGLLYVRVEKDDFGGDVVEEATPDGEVQVPDSIEVPVKPVNLTFKGVCYDVKASKGGDMLRLLDGINGIFTSKKMIALMGSSGAGKTTLMDVIAMRKSSGVVIGEILVNGFQQEKDTFRRVSGYVEQFDVQSPELTVRDTVSFSAQLRLSNEEGSIVATDDAKERYVDSVLHTLELTKIADCLVGSDDEGFGLTFEQRKRLSIAIELAAAPSIIFLDEPTSGLDARAAAVVVRALRHIADSGRTVIATIHQPSLAVFEMFDELLLLKTGGKTVFSGELGDKCQHLISYFESLGANRIEVGENPANWMLKVITAENAPCDYVEEFSKSLNNEEILRNIDEAVQNPIQKDEIKFETKFAASMRTRQYKTNKRLRTIYYRSPAYNLGRILISMGIAFILGSVFVHSRHQNELTETEMSSVFSTIFIAFIIIGVLAILSVLPVMLKIRDSFYRHRAAGMIGSNSVALGLGVAEKWFIMLSSALFCVIFLATAGVAHIKIREMVGFYGFFTFNLAIYSYFGQAFMCLVRGMGTAQILCSVFIGLNNFFSGLIVRPQYLVGIFQFTYWITPGHYVYEGMIVTLFHDDQRTVLASDNSQFFDDLGCALDQTDPCQGTVEDFVISFFGGKFQRSNLFADIWILAAYLVVARLATFFALKFFSYTST